MKEEIRYAHKWVTTDLADIFASDVPDKKIRYVLKIIITGDQQAARVIDLYKRKRDDTTAPFVLNVNVEAPEYKEIPQGVYDPEKPILVLEGGTNLAAKVSGNSLSVTVVYRDDII